MPLLQQYVDALAENGPRSARDLSVDLGLRTSRAAVATVRRQLELLERAGAVQRSRKGDVGPWIWEAVIGS